MRLRRLALLTLLLVLLSTSLVWAATPTFIEAGTNATFGTEFYAATVGSPTSDSTVHHTGPRSLKLTGTATAEQPTGVWSNQGRLTFYYQPGVLPNAASENVLGIFNASSGIQVYLSLTAAGVLQLFSNSGPAQIGSDGPTLSTGTWYRLSVAFTFTSSTVSEWRVFVDGTPAITGSNPTVPSSATISGFRFIARSGGGQIGYYSDVYADNGNTLDDPGDIRVTAKLPASNNVNQFDTAIGANPANRWTNVNERPLSETNGWEQSASVSLIRENYGIQAASAGDVNLSSVTIVARSAWVWAKITGGSSTGHFLTDNGTDQTISITTTPALLAILTATSSYPTNAATIGMYTEGLNLPMFLYECGMLIAYTPAPPLTPQPRSGIL